MVRQLSIIALSLLFLPWIGLGQAPGVPVYRMGKGSRRDAAMLTQCKELQTKGKLLAGSAVDEQAKRPQCQLALPPASISKLDSRELWKRARLSHLRIGWYYLCNDCERWHLDLAGGYAISKNCAATCGHILSHEDMKEAYLIAVNDEDHVIPVVEVLAANLATDSAILRLDSESLLPLPLGTDVVPGDHVWCFSDPIDRRGFFSEGVVNQFVQRPFLRASELTESERADWKKLEHPIIITVSSDWAPGSSGSAVIDACGNVVGHVSEIQSILEDPLSESKKAQRVARGTVIVFHDAVGAANVKALILTKP